MKLQIYFLMENPTYLLVFVTQCICNLVVFLRPIVNIVPKSELQIEALIFSLLVESKPRPPCLSTPSAVGKKATNHVLVKGSSTSHTPVQQTPSSRPVSHTEPRAAPHSRYDPTAASLKTGFGF